MAVVVQVLGCGHAMHCPSKDVAAVSGGVAVGGHEVS